MLELKNILLLDGNQEDAEMTRASLMREGYHVKVAASGWEAIDDLRAQDFSAVICDLRAPGVADEGFLHAVYQVRPHLISRFLFLADEEVDWTLADGTRPTVLTKPAEFGALLDALHLVLSGVGSGHEPALRGDDRHVEAREANALLSPEAPGGPSSSRQTWFATSSAPRERSRLSRFLRRSFAGLVLFAIIFGWAASWHVAVKAHTDALSVQRAALQTEVAASLGELAKHHALQPEVHTQLGAGARYRTELNAPRWGQCLRHLALCAGKEIELSAVNAVVDDSTGALEIRIKGKVSHVSPQTAADKFRDELERQMRASFASARVKFEQWEPVWTPSPGAFFQIAARMPTRSPQLPALSH